MGRNGRRDEAAAADDAPFADDCVAAENRSAGINGDVVFDGRVALDVFKTLPAFSGQGTEGDPLIDFNVVADDRCFPNDDAGAVVDEEIFADGRAGVNVDAGDPVGDFRHHPGQNRHVKFVKAVGQPVDQGGVESGVGEDDFVLVESRRITVVSGLDVGFRVGPDFRKLL